MTAPTISSATLVGSTLTIGGSNFGTKLTAAPVRYRNWQGLTNGSSSDAVAQFDAFEFVNFINGSTFTTDNTGGIGGGGSLKVVANCVGAGEMFTHHEFTLPGTTYVRVSQWVKFQRTTSNTAGTFSQQKGFRFGYTPHTSPADYSSSRPLIDFSYLSTDPAETDPIWLLGAWDSSSGGHGDWTPNTAATRPAMLTDGLYHFVEMETQLNTAGSANGIINVWIDGALIATYSNMQALATLGQTLLWFQPSPGFANDMEDNNWIMWESHHYVDTTPAQVFLAVESTLAGVTTKYLLPPVTWAGGAITATDAPLAPTGYNYVYVTNSAGEVNTTGFAYTGGSTFQPAWAINCNAGIA